jgi:protein-S-isoprenylcysteine O-methyltransferase Ste14
MEASATPELRGKAIRSMLQFQIFVAVIIFLSAWSLRFWQGWLFWLVFSVLVWWITLYFLRHDPDLIARRMKAGPSAEQRTTQKFVQALAIILAAALVVVPGLDHHFGWSSVSAPISLIADAMVVLGFAIIFQVFKANSFAASTIKVEAEQRVISTGPYAMVRHPMYSGASIALIATPLALGSLCGLPAALLLIAVLVVRLLDEERYLAANLAGYDSYRSKVRFRLVPMIW